MSKSLKHDRFFDEYEFEHEDNIEKRRKEEKERRRNRRKDFDLEEATEPYVAPYNESTSRNRKFSR